MRKMTSRERVIAALEHKEPDFVPTDMWIITDTYRHLRRYLNLPEKEDVASGAIFVWLKAAQVDLDVVEKLDLDIVRVSTNPPEGKGLKLQPDGLYVDEWNVKFKEIEYTPPIEGSYFAIVDPPLKDATIGDLDDFPWPNPSDPAVVEGLREKVREIRENTDCAIMGQFGRGGPFETAKILRGYEQLYIDLVVNPDLVLALFERIAQLEMEYNRVGLEAVGEEIDILRLTPEDLGGTESPQISPRMFERYVRPYYKKIWSFVKGMYLEKNPRGKLQFHSCGNVYPFMKSMIEDGLDVFDSLMKAQDMEPSRLKRDFGEKISFLGGIDVQHTLPKGTKEEVREEVKLRIEELGPGGGYILSSSHRLLPDVPPQNIVTMYEAAREFGQYPIKARR